MNFDNIELAAAELRNEPWVTPVSMNADPAVRAYLAAATPTRVHELVQIVKRHAVENERLVLELAAETQRADMLLEQGKIAAAAMQSEQERCTAALEYAEQLKSELAEFKVAQQGGGELPQDEQVLQQVTGALQHAMRICDAVPTRLHLSADETQAHIGRLVNAQDDGFHGYAVIHDALEAVNALAQRAGQVAELPQDEHDAVADLRHAVMESATDEWILGFVRQYPFVQRAASVPAQALGTDCGPVRVLTDAEIVTVLHSLGIDTFASKYGFPEIQVSATNLPAVRKIIAGCNAIAAPAPAASGQRATITLSGHQLRIALDLINPDGLADRDQLDDDLTFGVRQHRDDDGTVSTGMCCWNDDTDGVLPLDGEYEATPAVQTDIGRDAALEEAANKATSFLVGDPANGIPLKSPTPHQIAAAIRSLATQPAPSDAGRDAALVDTPEFVEAKDALIEAGVKSSQTGAKCDVEAYLAAEQHFVETVQKLATQAAPEVASVPDAGGEPYGWQQHIDGVRTQNFARDEGELSQIKMVFRLMKTPGVDTYLPLYTRPQPAPAVLSVENIALVVERLETISAGNTDDPRTLASEALVCARAVLAAANK